MKHFNPLITLCLTLPSVVSCAGMGSSSSASVNEETIPELPPYSGPRARVVVKELDWNNAPGQSFKMKGPDGEVEWSFEQRQNVGADLGELIADAMTNSSRFSVLDRSVIEEIERENELVKKGASDASSGAQSGNVQRPDVYVVINVQEFNPNAGGSNIAAGALGLVGRSLTGGLVGVSAETGKVVLQVKLVDGTTTETLNSTVVEAVAKSSAFTVGGLGLGGGVLAGGALSQWEGKPMGAAIRKAVAKAVTVVAEKTPQKYFAHE